MYYHEADFIIVEHFIIVDKIGVTFQKQHIL